MTKPNWRSVGYACLFSPIFLIPIAVALVFSGHPIIMMVGLATFVGSLTVVPVVGLIIALANIGD